MAIQSDSVSNCRTMRPPPAPIETRIARSRLRSAMRAANRLARFAQAASSTSAAINITPPANARVGSRPADPATPGTLSVSRMPSFDV
jgi:hypothetical protein